MPSRLPYEGSTRKLVLAFDIGTTYSGISYAVLDPGETPEIKGVTRFPAQEHVGGDSKIPSILYYDENGKPCAFGAEALQQNIVEQAIDEEWQKVEWFKLHLRPKNMPGSHVTSVDIPSLPLTVTVIDVFADFMKYLYQCTATYIQESSGTDTWQSLKLNIDYVLTHPNGWGGREQHQMRRAAIKAGLVGDDAVGHRRIQFVTEGEASLNFCLSTGLRTAGMKTGQGAIIADAGGGTLDISAYYIALDSKSVEETSPAECHLQGSIYVTRRANVFLKDKFKHSRFATDVDEMTKCFDRTTKLRFKKNTDPSYIKFGSARDKDLSLDVRGGQLKLSGADVAAFFDPSVQCIADTVVDQVKTSTRPISVVFLVGGFSASDYLFTKLQSYLQPIGLELRRPDAHLSKAVADGALSFYLDHFVSTRVARFDYGVKCNIAYKPMQPAHAQRAHRAYTNLAGHRRMPGVFSRILSKGTQVQEAQEFRSPYHQYFSNLSFFQFRTTILYHKGSSSHPYWIDEARNTNDFTELCTITGDMSAYTRTLNPKINSSGAIYYKLHFDIILLFGLTELKAQLAWKENGKEVRGPAETLYED